MLRARLISLTVILVCFNVFSFNEIVDSATDDDFDCQSYYDEYFKKNVISRQKWKAEPARAGMEKDLIKCKFAIHHSAGSSVSSGETVKNIQHMHIHEKKWSDIGYHFLIGRDGKCFEGRKLQWQGAHVEGDNKGNIGICFLGCFERSEPNSVETTPNRIERAGEIVGVLASKYNVTLSDNFLKGHRQHRNTHTVGPGDLVMECLDEILAKAIDVKNNIGN